MQSKWWAAGMLRASTVGQVFKCKVHLQSPFTSPKTWALLSVMCMTTYLLHPVILWQLNQKKSIAVSTNAPTSPSVFLCHLHWAAGLSVQFPSTSCVSKATPFSPTPHAPELPFKPQVLGLLCSYHTEEDGDSQEYGVAPGPGFFLCIPASDVCCSFRKP